MLRFFTSILLVLSLGLSSFVSVEAVDLSQKPESWFSSEEGRKAMECILSWQSEHGDWPKNKDTSTKPYEGERAKIKGTFDNGAPQANCALWLALLVPLAMNATKRPSSKAWTIF